MTKNHIALLLPALLALSTGAHAQQSSVTLYGLVDTGIFHERVKEDGITKKKNGLKSGGQGGSRWGLRGMEDLGNGYRVNFELESGFNMTNGEQSFSRLFGRAAWLGVSGDFGDVRFGRAMTVSTEFASSAISPFGGGFTQAALGRSGFRASDNPRYDNQVKYLSPIFSGLQLGLGYSFNTKGEQQDASDNSRALNLAAKYASGAVTLVATYDRLWTPADDPNARGRNPSALQLGGNYNFGSFQLYAGWTRQSDGWVKSAEGAPTGSNYLGSAGYFDGHVDAYAIGTKFKMGGGSVLASYQYVDAGREAFPDRKNVNVYNLGYTYPLSKRTNLYAYGSLIDGDLYNFRHRSYSRLIGAGILHKF